MAAVQRQALGTRVWLAAGLIVIGAGLAVVAILGPLVTEAIDYHVTEALRSQTIGLDAVSLFVVAPLSILAALLVLRGHVAGPALGLGIGAYTSYIYLAGPTFSWAIAMLDLGVFLPATVAARVGVVRQTSWARKLYTVVGWFAFVGAAVAAMAIAMYVNDDPNASGAHVLFMTVLGVVFVLLATFLYRPLFRRA